MFTLIGIFYGSLIGMILMLLLKGREVRTGKASIFSRIGSGADAFFHSIFATVSRGISYINRHTFVELAHWLAYHILRPIRTAYVNLKSWALANPHGRKLLDAVRGRGEIRNHGASFYLRRISDR